MCRHPDADAAVVDQVVGRDRRRTPPEIVRRPDHDLRQVLGIDPSMKMLFGISFRYPDTAHAANQYRIGKAPV